MPVTDEEVAVLRAQLAGDFAEYERGLKDLDRESLATGYAVLVQAAFFEASYRRFGKPPDVEKVIDFVATLRSSASELEDIDPRQAERIIRAILGDGSAMDIDDQTRLGVQSVLLARLAADAEFDDTELDAFMTEARSTADYLLSDDDGKA